MNGYLNTLKLKKIYFVAHQSTISLAENTTLMNKDIFLNGTTLSWSYEAITLFVGEPFDAS
jgi:hypothetical protein